MRNTLRRILIIARLQQIKQGRGRRALHISYLEPNVSDIPLKVHLGKACVLMQLSSGTELLVQPATSGAR
jgi:hypothetical protein